MVACLTAVNLLVGRKRNITIKMQGLLWIVLVYFLFLLILVLKAIDFIDGLKIIQKKLPILILPFIVYLNKDLISKNITLFYKTFIVAVVIASLFCFLEIVGDWQLSEKSFKELFTYYRFTSSYFSGKLDIHPSYFSNFILLAVIFINKLLEHSLKTTTKLLLIIFWLFLSFIIIQLASRIHILNYLFLILFFAFISFKKQARGKNLFKFFKITLVFGAIAFLLTSEFVKNRFEQGYDIYFNQGKNYPQYYESSRMHVWKHFPNEFSKSPVFGLGTGNENTSLRQNLVKDNYQRGIEKRLNYHNQYLQELTRSGLVGFLLFTGILYLFFQRGTTEKNQAFILFLIFNCLFLFFESVFERHRGVVFFFFFASVFYFCQTKQITSKNNST
jgi:O-antigen ligase